MSTLLVYNIIATGIIFSLTCIILYLLMNKFRQKAEVCAIKLGTCEYFSKI
jgi:hypothetical protein